MMDDLTFRKFLVQAKKNTYAGNGEGKETKKADGSKNFCFKKGSLRYEDRYYGFDPFIGEEILWVGTKAVWGMNYYGGISLEKVDPAKVYSFLKECLGKVKIDAPYRGPNKYTKGTLRYNNSWTGTLENFQGMECIYFKNKKIYELHYHGGSVKSKVA